MSDGSREMDNLFSAIESLLRRASAADRAYLLSRGFKEYFAEDGGWLPEKLAFFRDGAGKMAPFFMLMHGGSAFLDSFLHDVSRGSVSSAEGATRALVEAMREVRAPASDRMSLPLLSAVAMRLGASAGERDRKAAAAPPPGPLPIIAPPGSEAHDVEQGRRDLEQILGDQISMLLSPVRKKLPQEAWERLLARLAREISPEYAADILLFAADRIENEA